jgi:WD40 repeat protein
VNPLFANSVPAAATGDVDVSVFAQHHGYVNSLAFHPDGKARDFCSSSMDVDTVGLVVSGGQDKLIYVHRPGDSQPSHVLVGHENNVSPS